MQPPDKEQTSSTFSTQILDSLIEGCQIISKDWRYLYLNDTAVRHSHKERNELIGRTMMECYPGIENTKLFAEMKRCMINHIATRTESECEFLEGDKGWFRFIIHPHPQGILLLCEDISDLKRIQDALKESEALYHELVSKSPNVIIVRKDGKIIFANPAASLLGEYTPQELINRSVYDFIDESYRKIVEKNTINRTKGMNLPDYEIKVLTKSGEHKDMLVRGSVITYKGEPAALNVLIDITEIKRIEEELRENKEILQQTLDNMMEGCQVISRDWRYLYLNDAVVRHGRKTRKELIGRTMMECYPGIEKTEMFKGLNKCMTNRIPLMIDNEFTFPDGVKQWFRLSVHPHPQGIFILSEDITQLKKNAPKSDQ